MTIIFFDVDTQNDFMNRSGELYIPNAELIKPNLNLLTEYAKKNKIPVLGSVDRHFSTPMYRKREKELEKWGGPFPDHCISNSYGQEKILETILKYKYNDSYSWGRSNAGIFIEHSYYQGYPKRAIPFKVREFWGKSHYEEFVKNKWEELRTGIFKGYLEDSSNEINLVKNKKKSPKGIYFEKQSFDVFSNPMTELVLREANVKQAFVYGVATDYCVKAAVLGMLKRGIECYVIEDAIKGVNPKATLEAINQMKCSGAGFIKTDDVFKIMEEENENSDIQYFSRHNIMQC